MLSLKCIKEITKMERTLVEILSMMINNEFLSSSTTLE